MVVASFSMAESLTTIFDRHNTDKGSSFHNYCRQYNTLFRDLRDKPITYLEIGVFNGGSLRAMREAFPNAVRIVGLDINPGCKVHEDRRKNIFVEIGSATDSAFVEQIMRKYGPFDLILDDGSHVNTDVFRTFELLFPTLKDVGLYVVEDTCCTRLPGFVTRGTPNHLQYFHKLTEILNMTRNDSTTGVRDHCCDPFKIQKKMGEVERGIDRIEFGCSFIAIHKLVRHHWK